MAEQTSQDRKAARLKDLQKQGLDKFKKSPIPGMGKKKKGPGPSSVPGPKAGPNDSFPVGDAKHQRLAIGGATRSYNAGNISKGQEDAIKADARKRLAAGKGK